MTIDYWVGSAMTVFLIVYLVYALLWPERF